MAQTLNLRRLSLFFSFKSPLNQKSMVREVPANRLIKNQLFFKLLKCMIR